MPAIDASKKPTEIKGCQMIPANELLCYGFNFFLLSTEADVQWKCFVLATQFDFLFYDLKPISYIFYFRRLSEADI